MLRDLNGNFAAGTIMAALFSGNATSATSFTGPLVGEVTGTQGATVVSSVGGQSAATVAAGAVLANAATSTNTANAIVKRDGSGNFSAGTITATLNGSATNNVLKAGDTMTGTLVLPAGTTTLPSLTFTGSSTTGLSANSGNLSLSTNGSEQLKISSGGTISIDGFTIAGVVHNDASGNLSTSLIVNADVSPAAAITDSKLATISTAGKVANSATTAISTNTPSTIVLRDTNGNFLAGTITAALNGNATTATTAINTTNFTGPLLGDVTGTQGATVVSLVGGQTAANVAAGTLLANAATSANVANTIVKRDASGNFSANDIFATVLNVSALDLIAPVSVVNGGTGDITLAAHGVLLGEGTSPVVATVSTTAGQLFVGGGATIDPTWVTPVAGNGLTLISNASTLDYLLSTPVIVANGGTGATSLTANSLLLGNGTSAVSALGAATNGQIPIGSTGAAPTLATLTAGSNVTITNNPGSITIAAGSGSGATTFNTGSGTATTASNAITNAGGTGITTSGSGSTVTVALTTPVSVATGGTGDASLTAHGVLIGEGTSAVNVTAAGTAGQVFLGTSATTDPVWVTPTAGTGLTLISNASTLDYLLSTPVIVANGGTGATSFTANSLLLGNGTSAVSALGAATNGQIPIGSTGAAPVLSTITAGSNVTVTNGTGTITVGVSVQIPPTSREIYVATYGNDVTGNGSYLNPYASLAEALTIANSIATTTNPVVIHIEPGTYTENNSAGPLTITANGISILGASQSGTFIIPSSLSFGLLSVATTTTISNITFQVSGVSSATCLSCTSGYFTTLSNVTIVNFQTGLYCEGSNSTYILQNCIFKNNGTGLSINNTTVNGVECTIIGTCSTNEVPISTGITITGSTALLNLDSSSCTLCGNALSMSSSAQVFINAVNFQLNIFDILVTLGAQLSVSDSNFLTTFSSSDLKININGTGSFAEIIGCIFNGFSSIGSVQGSALQVSGGAQAYINGGSIMNYTTALTDGISTDTSTTILTVDSLHIQNCTNDIVQNGTTSLDVMASNVSSSKITLNSTTNVYLSYYDLVNNNAFVVPAGTAASPSLKFSGSTNTGISAATANTLSFDTNGVEGMNISTTLINALLPLVIKTLICNQGLQTVSVSSSSTVVAAATTSILLLNPTTTGLTTTVTFPSSPTNGQYFTIVNGTTTALTLAVTAGSTVVNAITSLASTGTWLATTGGASVTYYFDSTGTTWYRIGRG